MKRLIKKNECPINAIAERVSTFQGKLISITRPMMQKLVDEAMEAGEENVQTTKLADNETKYDVVIPGEITTKLSMVLKEDNGIDTVFLLSVEAEDIPGLRLNDNYKVCPGWHNTVHFEYEAEDEQ